MADFKVSLDELRRLKKKLEDSESQLDEALRRMKDTGPSEYAPRAGPGRSSRTGGTSTAATC